MRAYVALLGHCHRNSLLTLKKNMLREASLSSLFGSLLRNLKRRTLNLDPLADKHQSDNLKRKAYSAMLDHWFHAARQQLLQELARKSSEVIKISHRKKKKFKNDRHR